MQGDFRRDDVVVDELESRIIGEIGSFDSVATDIPVSDRLVQKIKSADPDAQFAVFEIEPAVSGSKRNWKPEHFEEMAKVINEKHPVAYKGHISEKDDATAFPTIHGIWVGAKTFFDKGKKKLKCKVYLKTKEIRDEVAMEMVDSISPRGNVVMRPLKGGVLDVLSFTMESMDFARKGRNGLPSRLVSIAAEMEDKDRKGGRKVEPNEIAALKEEELRANNPLLVKSIEDAAKEPLSKTIGEMTTAADVVKPELDILAEIRKILGLGENDNPLDSVAELHEAVEDHSKGRVRNFIKEAIKGKVKSERAANLVNRMVGEQIEADFMDFDGDDDKLKKEIDGKLDTYLDEDEDVKAIVGEMHEEPARKPSDGGRSMGGKSTRNRESEGRSSRTGGVKFGKTTRHDL